MVEGTDVFIDRFINFDLNSKSRYYFFSDIDEETPESYVDNHPAQMENKGTQMKKVKVKKDEVKNDKVQTTSFALMNVMIAELKLDAFNS